MIYGGMYTLFSRKRCIFRRNFIWMFCKVTELRKFNRCVSWTINSLNSSNKTTKIPRKPSKKPHLENKVCLFSNLLSSATLSHNHYNKLNLNRLRFTLQLATHVLCVCIILHATLLSSLVGWSKLEPILSSMCLKKGPENTF